MTEPVQDALPPLSAETLPLYLPLWKDGVLAEDVMAAVAALAQGNAEAEAILEMLDRADDRLGAAFGDVLTQPVPMALAQGALRAGAALDRGTPEPANLQRRPAMIAAAAAAFALLVGAPGGYLIGKSAGREAAETDAATRIAARFGWVAQIVGYHRLYSAESRHLVEVSADQGAHIEAWIGKRTGRAFRIPDLSSAGLTFRGARLLAVNGTPTAQLMYVPDGGGAPVGLCFLRSDQPDQARTVQSRDGFNMVTWRRDGYAFIAIGALPAEQIGRAASAAEAYL